MIYKRLLEVISYWYFISKPFKGKTKMFRAVFDFIPKVNSSLTHNLDFNWLVHSRESLWTFLVSCELQTTKVLRSEIDSASTFICVGANFGWYPLVARALNAKVDIYCFECDSTARTWLERNLEINQYKVAVSSNAISDQVMVKNLYRPEVSNDGMSTLYPRDVESKRSLFVETVNVITMDSYFREKYHLLGKTIVLMDIEGAEMRALIGAMEFLAKVKPTLILEICSNLIESSGYATKDVFLFLQKYGYQAFWIDERGSVAKVEDFDALPHIDVLPEGSGANYLFKLK